jgi:chorismate-pyruvate lyase
MPAAALRSPAPETEALHEALLASASATAVVRQMFGDPVEIQRMPAVAEPPDADICADLASDPDAIVHRRVTLRAAGRAVSEADLWYVPGRLPPDMAEALATTNIPFGTIVAPLRPSRELASFRFCHPPEHSVLEHRALLRDANGNPIAFVHERYLPV